LNPYFDIYFTVVSGVEKKIGFIVGKSQSVGANNYSPFLIPCHYRTKDFSPLLLLIFVLILIKDRKREEITDISATTA